MTRQRELEFSDAVRARWPIMHEALLQVGHRQTRNRGTIGGSLCHLDPAAELVSLATGYDATVTVAGPNGQRELPFAEFPVAYMTPAIELNEIVVGVRFPQWAPKHGYAFVEFSRRHGDFAITSAAVLIEGDAAGKITRASVTIGGMGTAPCRAREVEQAITGQVPGKELVPRRPAKAAASSKRSTTCTRRRPIASIWRRCCRGARWRRRMRASPAPIPARRGRIRSIDGRDPQNCADGQRQALRGRGRGARDARRFRAPPARPHRHASGLRAWRLRRLHHPARRALRALLPDAGGAGGRARASHRRGHRAVGRQAARAAAVLSRASRPAVRLLHARACSPR